MTVWRKSTRSGSSGDCVEVADDLPQIVRIRDSKSPTGPILAFGDLAWHDFVTCVKRGAFDRN